MLFLLNQAIHIVGKHFDPPGMVGMPMAYAPLLDDSFVTSYIYYGG
jgi:hypothetical protein